MAKSTRSKIKRQWRAKKRENSVYAATDAARLHRLHSKLKAIAETDAEAVQEEGAVLEEQDADGDQSEMRDDAHIAGNTPDTGAAMDIDSTNTESKRISTHGPRGSRKEEWRKSKGLSARPPSRGINRQGMPAARRKSGRSQRRR